MDKVIAIISILLMVTAAIVYFLMKTVFNWLPYASGFIGAIFLSWSFPALRNIVPGEGRLSFIMLILLIEILIGVLVNIPQTSGPVILLTSMIFVEIAMVVASSGIKCASWQKALAVTIIYLISVSAILSANHSYNATKEVAKRNIFASGIVSVMYAATVGINLLIILGEIWAKYVKVAASEEVYKIYDKVGLIVITIAMAGTAILSFVHDRKKNGDAIVIEVSEEEIEAIKVANFIRDDKEH